LDHFVICGERHLRHVLREYLAHHNSERPHQAKGNVLPPEADRKEPAIAPDASGECSVASGWVLVSIEFDEHLSGARVQDAIHSLGSA
jgi:hypothetical protein